MSLKLLKQSLDILDEPITTGKKDPFAKNSGIKYKRPTSKKKTAANKDLKFQSQFNRKNNIEELRKEIMPDKNKTNMNLKRLLALSQNTINVADAEKIIKRNNKSKTVKKVKKTKEPKSIFTEEDFLAFEKEYFSMNT